MMDTYDNSEAVGLNATDFLGNYLAKEDLNGETVVRVIEVRAEDVPGANRRKLVAQFAEFEKPMVLNSTNIKRLAKIFGSANTAHWRGPVTLYVDEHVEYGGKAVGGLRVKPAGRNGAPVRIEQPTVRPSYVDEADIF